MRYLPLIVLACLFIAGLQAATTVVALLLLTALVIGFVTKPWETCASLGFMALLGLLQARPTVGLAVLGIIAITAIALNKRSTRNHNADKATLKPAKGRVAPPLLLQHTPADRSPGE